MHDTPKHIQRIVWGPQHLFKKLPKFAVRLGAALTAMAVCGLAYDMATHTDPFFTKVMMWAGGIGAGLTALFGKK